MNIKIFPLSIRLIVLILSFVLVQSCNKLSPHFVIYVFLGYDEGQKGYHCFDLISHKLYVFHHAFFLEHIHFISIPTY
ncbi:unnamed protein product, partial [Vitis vinifera]|uniref:Retroviral polymerase SH3-like domain-containing protein n=1 Tax=Vitis vinifera TaxID=29760 RepID=D7U9R0_VITVI